MPLPGSWVPTGDGSQLLYDTLEEMDLALNLTADASDLQAALDSDSENIRRLNLPMGEIEHSATIDIDGGSGGGIYGMGRNEPVLLADAACRSSSTLVYTGTKASNEAAITYKRSDFVFQDLSIQGKSTADVRDGTGTRTPRGIAVVRDASAGTGKFDMRNVRFSGFDVAIDSGDGLGVFNCDESGYYSVFSDRNGTFFRSNNIQGLSHKFYNLRISNTDIVFDYIAGGKLAVTDCLITGAPATLLQLRNDETTGFGPNGSRWVFRGVDIDSQSVDSYLLNCESGIDYWGHVIFDGVHHPDSAVTNPGIHVGDNMVVVVNDFCNLPANYVSWNCGSNESVIIFNNPKVHSGVSAPADIFKLSGSVGNLRCIVSMGFQPSTYALLNSGTLYNQVLTGV